MKKRTKKGGEGRGRGERTRMKRKNEGKLSLSLKRSNEVFKKNQMTKHKGKIEETFQKKTMKGGKTKRKRKGIG
jgi:hypothetical protein